MSNRASLVRTDFKDHSGTSYGYRCYDDYDQTYSNYAENPLPADPQELLNIVICELSNDTFNVILEVALMKGMYIDEDWIDREELNVMVENATKLKDQLDKKPRSC